MSYQIYQTYTPAVSFGKMNLLFLFTLFSIFASSQNPFETSQNNLSIDMLMSTEINTLKKGNLKSLRVKYLFVPKSDERQKVISIHYHSHPEADFTDILKGQYTWKKLHSNYSVSYDARIKTNNYLYPVKSTPFPVIDIPDSLKNFLRFDDIINQKKTIEKTALELVRHETELYNAVFNIGYWIYENIDYLRTGFETIESASTVFNTKFGDCDEISVLYLSMLRSVYIPSRLVSGIAKGEFGFNYHAWVEVFFENTGWVPFDATFRQFGYIDQSHIKLAQHHTVSEMFSTTWEFLPFFGDVEIESEELPVVSAQITAQQNVSTQNFTIQIFPFTEKVGIYSSYPVKILIKNNTPFFTSEMFYLNYASDVEINIEKEKYLLNFAPYETKEINLYLTYSGIKYSNYRYTSLFKVFNRTGINDTTTVIFYPGAKIISEKMANAILDTFSVPKVVDEHNNNF
ncbi:transglutaminase-like domain-containing protein [Maribellus maritimus]|uniref:transglutaminase-like domain-containing protein n=1 Tax=Maribellus maritimus TaxID=2870838 RepID=UPI001EE9AEF2|nr:transglutaminase domain-containing protein [Maribellus maritimus]MCG6187166.1 transglutaminase domain-containing protein [Maribellus maritimus]